MTRLDRVACVNPRSSRAAVQNYGWCVAGYARKLCPLGLEATLRDRSSGDAGMLV